MVKRKNDGRTTDLDMKWFTNTYGEQWEEWRALGEKWLNLQDIGLDDKRDAIVKLFEQYFAKTNPSVSELARFFEGHNGWFPSTHDFKENIISNTRRSDNSSLTRLLNHATSFIDWVLETHLSEANDKGIKRPIYQNPFESVKKNESNTESVHNPLPYRYICDLRHILCPNPKGHFSDWTWAQNQTGTSGGHGFYGDWFEVDKSLIKEDDPDCIWREKTVKRKNHKKINIYQIWSPVAAMVLFLKLYLPLRTYQVRMLDSGEADEMRYTKGQWIKNDAHPFAIKGLKKGVFKRFKDNATGLVSTGFYINTNKTADQNKDELERGYSIPWQNEEVIYWLEKLRNWQENYNPINNPTDCLTLEVKHTRRVQSNAYLTSMGHISFLMRDAASVGIDKTKPIPEEPVQKLWYKLLRQLEHNLLVSGETLSSGEKLKLVHEYPADYKPDKKKTHFPLHSLRVSLITSYVIDAKLPLPVVSKLLAGHSRLIMTIYYTKLTPGVMQEKMNEAQALLEDEEQQSIRAFLKDAELRQIQSKTAYSSLESIEVALVNRNPIGWENRHHGLCLAGGNTARSDESKTVAGCWNGGELIQKAGAAIVYAPVSHGPENCPRCRWFITDARYLPALNSHLNFMSYKAHEAANLSVKIEGEIEALEEEKYICESQKKPFAKHSELQKLQRRHEKQVVESDEYTKDFLATFKLIKRLVEIEKERVEGDTKNKLVAVGSEDDIKLGFIETTSELFQLSLLCKDAEVYPEMLDDIKKTPVIERTAQHLSRIMMKKGYMPQLLMMDNEQQMIAANAMMREMAFLADPNNQIKGYQIATNYLEMEEYLKDSRLLDGGLLALERKTNQPLAGISVKTLLKSIDGGLTDAN